MADAEMVVHEAAPGVGIGVHPGYQSWPHIVTPLPNVSLMDSIGAESLEKFFIVGEGWASLLARYLTHGATVLDIGCGCGRTARFLLLRPDIRYIGFDIFKPAIDWANEHVVPLTGGRFRFEHFDGYSAHYNPRGNLKAAQFAFPPRTPPSTWRSPPRSSPTSWRMTPTTTWRRPPRTLVAGRKLVTSIHDEPKPGERVSGREDRVDIDRRHFIGMAERAGLGWWRTWLVPGAGDTRLRTQVIFLPAGLGHPVEFAPLPEQFQIPPRRRPSGGVFA
jgi:SAM-dependent methyltransferase